MLVNKLQYLFSFLRIQYQGQHRLAFRYNCTQIVIIYVKLSPNTRNTINWVHSDSQRLKNQSPIKLSSVSSGSYKHVRLLENDSKMENCSKWFKDCNCILSMQFLHRMPSIVPSYLVQIQSQTKQQQHFFMAVDSWVYYLLWTIPSGIEKPAYI